jgi:hypothetical protein
VGVCIGTEVSSTGYSLGWRHRLSTTGKIAKGRTEERLRRD